MIFFNRKALVDRLGKAPLTSSESLHYMIGSLALIALYKLMDLPAEASWPNSLAAIAIRVLMPACVLGIFILLLKWMYRANGGDQGKDFATNLLAVMFVVDCQTLVPQFVIYASYQALQIYVDAGGVSLMAIGIFVLMALAVPSLIIYTLIAVPKSLREIHRRRLIPAVDGSAAEI